MHLVEYGGWPNNLLLTNGEVELIVTLAVGPRAICYRVPHGMNVMKNYPAMMGGTHEPEWQIRGGHRFWLAPEDLTRTYYPDNGPVAWTRLADYSAAFTPQPEHEYGVQKQITFTLQPTGTSVRVDMTVTNIGEYPTDLAPWGPTVLAPGGVEIIPLPPKRPHPGHPRNARSPADFAPNQQLILWPYFDFADPRWTFGSRYILLRQNPSMGPTKIGLAHREGWAAYWNQGTLFVKFLDYREGAVYPDCGTNYQTFSNEDMLEMETVGPLVTLAPGAAATLTEHWQLFTQVPPIQTEEDIDRFIRPLLK